MDNETITAIWKDIESSFDARDYDAVETKLNEAFPDGIPSDATGDFTTGKSHGNLFVARGLVRWHKGDKREAVEDFETGVDVGTGYGYSRSMILYTIAGSEIDAEEGLRLDIEYDAATQTSVARGEAAASWLEPRLSVAQVQENLSEYLSQNPEHSERVDAILSWLGVTLAAASEETGGPEYEGYSGPGLLQPDDLSALYDESLRPEFEAFLLSKAWEKLDGREFSDGPFAGQRFFCRPTEDLHDHLGQEDRDSAGPVIGSVGNESAPSALLCMATDGSITVWSPGADVESGTTAFGSIDQLRAAVDS